MIYGIGTDIARTSRFEKWVKNPDVIRRFFNPAEIKEIKSDEETERRLSSLCQHYAARFAAKEAFSKALGTGVRDFSLDEVYVKNDELGKPELFLKGAAESVFNKRCPSGKIHLSLSHEKEYATAFVVIEIPATVS